MRKTARCIVTVLVIMMVGASLSPAASQESCNQVCELQYDTASCYPHFFDALGGWDDCTAWCEFFDGYNYFNFIWCYCTGTRCEWV
ncbi:MAG: hypothetical protein QOK37_729 [Thermoanaerobaculia bacterium]|jgi:hypothetical protein|nr:hypothetical protein [Thermoanaerobaculia bacterium]